MSENHKCSKDSFPGCRENVTTTGADSALRLRVHHPGRWPCCRHQSGGSNALAQRAASEFVGAAVER
ncbi:hypothetical protein [Paenibacillus xylanivorans]|uniref:hypothetical protein n=1 Tax=Paenibacillus xylanivorans TaxID=1705561 RepID=UPI001364E0DB|nr:hypothetical protein [Paenibacillus xylanivorans]